MTPSTLDKLLFPSLLPFLMAPTEELFGPGAWQVQDEDWDRFRGVPVLRALGHSILYWVQVERRTRERGAACTDPRIIAVEEWGLQEGAMPDEILEPPFLERLVEQAWFAAAVFGGTGFLKWIGIQLPDGPVEKTLPAWVHRSCVIDDAYDTRIDTAYRCALHAVEEACRRLGLDPRDLPGRIRPSLASAASEIIPASIGHLHPLRGVVPDLLDMFPVPGGVIFRKAA